MVAGGHPGSLSPSAVWSTLLKTAGALTKMLRGPLDEPLLSDAPRRRQSSWRKDVVSICIIGATAALLFVSTGSPASTATMASSFVALAASDLPTGDNFVILPPCLHIMVGVALRGTGLLTATVAVVPALGSQAEGARAKSFAAVGNAEVGTAAEGTAEESATAAWQTTMGDVEAKSLSAHLQSLAARGQLLWALETGLRVTGSSRPSPPRIAPSRRRSGTRRPGPQGRSQTRRAPRSLRSSARWASLKARRLSSCELPRTVMPWRS